MIPICHKNEGYRQTPTIENKVLQGNSSNFSNETVFSRGGRMREQKTKEQAVTGAIGTKLRRKEFALRKVEIKLMKDGCCSSFHVFLIRQTPPQPKVICNNGLSPNKLNDK